MPEEKTDLAPITVDPRVEELYKAGVQFGYARTRRHPRMREYIAGVKSNVEIFHLERVDELLSKAFLFLEELGKTQGMVLWVGTKPAASPIIKAVADELGHPYVEARWLGGTLTNFDVIRKRVLFWQDLVSKQKSGELEKYTKQERLMIQKNIERLERDFIGILRLEAMPRAFFIIDPKEEEHSFHEALLKHIPVIALLNSDCDPQGIAYPIPGNDNAPESIRLILEKARDAYKRGSSLHVGN